MKRQLTTLFCVYIMAVCSFAQNISKPNKVDLDIQKGKVTFEVKINGKKIRFGYDSGASGDGVVTPELVKELNLPVVRQMKLSASSGTGSITSDVVRVDSLKLGGRTFKNLQVPVMQSYEKFDNEKQRTYGVIGFELFKDDLVTLDYPEKRLIFGKGNLPTLDGKSILSYRFERYTPFISFQIGNTELVGMVDSGGSGGFLLPLADASKLKLNSEPKVVGKIANSLNQVFNLYQAEVEGKAKIGAVEIENPMIRFCEAIKKPIIGREILHKFAITFDQKNQRIHFAMPKKQ